MPIIGRVLGLQDLSLDIITSVLRLLTTEEVLRARLVSRYFDSVVLDNIRYVIPSADQLRLNNSLISKVLYRRVPCAEEDANGSNAARLVAQLTSLASKIGNTTNNAERNRKTVCDALTVSKGREWVLDNLGRPAVDSCNGDYTMVLAAWLGLEDVVKSFLAGGSSANSQLEHLGSALYAAAYNDDESLTKLLIYHGADARRREGFYGDALQLAAYRGSDAVIPILICEILHASLHSNDCYDYLEEYGPFVSPLGAAAAAGHETSVQTLLSWESLLCNINNEEFWPEASLFLAVKNGRANVVQLLIDSNSIYKELLDSDENAYLMAAVAHNQESVVEVLLEYNKATRLLWREGVPVPLKMAAERGLVRMLEIFISYDLFSEEQLSSLLRVIAEQHANVVESLWDRRSFRRKASVQLRIDFLPWALKRGNDRLAHLLCKGQDRSLYSDYWVLYGEHVLHAVAYYNRHKLMATLLGKKEVNPNAKTDEGGKSPLMVAAENNSVGCIDVLLKNPRTERDDRDRRGMTALMYAVLHGCPRNLKLFQSCDPNVRDKTGGTALEHAMESKNSSAIDYLLSRDDLDLGLAFYSALCKGYPEVAESLLARENFDPNANGSLDLAIIQPNTRIAALLLARRDVDPNLPSQRWDQTPLCMAIGMNNVEVVKLLIAREDVDPNLIHGRETPLETAVSRGNREVVELLLNREDIDVNRGKLKPLMLALSLGDEQGILRLLLNDRRIDIYQEDHRGHTALTQAAGNGKLAILQLLLSNYSTLDLNHRVRGGDTALLKAAERDRKSAVQYLLDMGADINAQNDLGHTPLHAAAYNGFVGMVKLLKDNGANPNLVDKDGNTPYDAAIHAVKQLRGVSEDANKGPLWRRRSERFED